MTSQGKIIVAVDDMFFAAKILAVAASIMTTSGREIERVKSRDELERALAEGEAALLIIDLNSTRLNALEIIAGFKSQPAFAAVPVLGFLSHVQVELKRQAEQAGCDLVLPRSAFVQKLPDILSGNLP